MAAASGTSWVNKTSRSLSGTAGIWRNSWSIACRSCTRLAGTEGSCPTCVRLVRVQGDCRRDSVSCLTDGEGQGVWCGHARCPIGSGGRYIYGGICPLLACFGHRSQSFPGPWLLGVHCATVGVLTCHGEFLTRCRRVLRWLCGPQRRDNGQHYHVQELHNGDCDE